MGIRLLYGRAGSGKTAVCFEEIRQMMRRDPLGAPLILITPEQATFEAERELAQGGGFLPCPHFRLPQAGTLRAARNRWCC